MTFSLLNARIKAVDWWRALWRPVLAYLAASYSVGIILFGLLAEPTNNDHGFFMRAVVTVAVSISVAPYVAVLTAVPAALCILVIRLAKLPRGYSEVVAGTLCGILVASPFVNPHSGDPPDPLSLHFWSEVGPSALCGAVAGLVYWVANGRPRRQRRAEVA